MVFGVNTGKRGYFCLNENDYHLEVLELWLMLK